MALLMSTASIMGTGIGFWYSGRRRSRGPPHHELAVLLVDDHRRGHPGRVDRVDPDAVLRQLGRIQPHQPDHAVLGRAVRGLAPGGLC